MQSFEHIKQKLKSLKSELHALSIAYTDKRTPLVAKLMIGLTVGYFLSPIDLVPDFIPVLGILDDLLLVPMLIMFSIKLIPTEVMLDSRHTASASSANFTKNNWFFAIFIILIWILCLVGLINIFLFKR
jgi:uncharacterized membrane protein YkvA (DUF1232 family)